MAQYIVVTDGELTAFEREVNELLADGYKLAGDFQAMERTLHSGEKAWDYYQPMIKYNTAEKGESELRWRRE